MDSSPVGISITRNEITGSARVEIHLSQQSRPLAYRVTRQLGSDRYVIRDPLGAAIDGVPSLGWAIEIARGLAVIVRERAGENFDCCVLRELDKLVGKPHGRSLSNAHHAMTGAQTFFSASG